MNSKYDNVLQFLDSPQSNEISIISISEPISTAIPQGPEKRTSDVSQDVFEAPTPSSLETDLSHYKASSHSCLYASLWTFSNNIQELFSKLRFSYLEQVTKEKFIRAIVSDPPLLVEHSQNVELESQLVEAKIALKKDKVEVADMVEELGRRGRELSRKYDAIKLQTTRLRDLPEKIRGREVSIAKMKAAQAPDYDPTLNLPLDKTIALVEGKDQEAAELDQLLESLQTELLRKTRDLERAETELQPLEIKRLASTAAAKEAKRRKDEALGGVGDELEEQGRWWRGVEGGLKVILEA